MPTNIRSSPTGSEWPRGPSDIPSLKTGEIHVWCTITAWPPSRTQKYLSILSPDEQERASRFHFERDRSRYQASHISLRHLLSRYLGLPPKELPLETGPHGKPRLHSLGEEVPLHFNLSHAGDYSLLAFACSQAVGVDLESIHPFLDFHQIARRFFTIREIQAIESAAAEQQFEMFLRIWTCKEAVLKASGTGLQSPLTSIEIRALECDSPQAWTTDPKPPCLSTWQLRHLSPAPGMIGALASRAPFKLSHCWELQHPDEDSLS